MNCSVLYKIYCMSYGLWNAGVFASCRMPSCSVSLSAYSPDLYHVRQDRPTVQYNHIHMSGISNNLELTDFIKLGVTIMPLEVTALLNSLLSITPTQKLQNSSNGSDTNNTTSTLLQTTEMLCSKRCNSC
jgi:hypothetical protein